MAGDSRVSARPAQAKVFSCPSCGAGVVLRAQGKSLSAVCGSCGSVIDTSSENFRILSKFQINSRIQPLIPLGTRGKFRGDTWEVIGFLIRSSGAGGNVFLARIPALTTRSRAIVSSPNTMVTGHSSR